jgi:hypothetical protein
MCNTVEYLELVSPSVLMSKEREEEEGQMKVTLVKKFFGEGERLSLWTWLRQRWLCNHSFDTIVPTVMGDFSAMSVVRKTYCGKCGKEQGNDKAASQKSA